MSETLRIALVGNPNCGKTSLSITLLEHAKKLPTMQG